jgi:uncharacterized protein (TIGR02217 family)
MSFYEEPKFPECVAFGAVGGPMYLTEVVQVSSGFEQRNQVWQYGRCKWQVAHVPRPEDEMHQLLRFFRQMKGRLHGFRFKDYSDYQADAGGAGYVFAGDGHPSGEPTGQLYKRYEDSTSAYDVRLIQKPIATTVVLSKDGIVTAGWTLDDTTGLVTFAALASATVNSITNGNPPIVTTSAAHGFSNGQVIYLSGVTGMTEVNDRAFTIGSVTSSTFTLVGEDATDYGTFSSTATASRYPQPADTWTWTGEFDVPCRFDLDDMQIHILDRQGSGGLLIEAWEPVMLVEIRIPTAAEEDDEELLLGGFSSGFDGGFD